MQRLDLRRVEFRAGLVQVRVILDESTLRNVEHVRDRNTSVPRLHDVGGLAILAGEAQADGLYKI